MKALVSYNENAKEPKELYVSYEGETKKVVRLYTSVENESKLFYSAFDPVDPTNPDWDNLAGIVRSGRANEFVTISEVIRVRYGDTIMPMVVADIAPARLEDGTVVDNALYLICSQTSMEETRYHTLSYDEMTYETSTARAFLNETMLPAFDDNFTKYLGKTEAVSVAYGNNLGATYDKLWLPSSNQLGFSVGSSYNSAKQARVEGKTFAHFAGINSNSANPKRIFQTQRGLNAYCWTRSSDLNLIGQQVVVTGSGSAFSDAKSELFFVAPVCVFTGIDDTPAPLPPAETEEPEPEPEAPEGDTTEEEKEDSE